MNTATNNEVTLESILEQVRVMQVRSDERAKVTGENFNVFSILHMERKEVETHSAIIAELLNPHGSHSQGTLFLKLFLEKLLKKDCLSDEDLKKFKVGVEVSFNKGQNRIDILIEKEDCCIVIENKIGAGDQPEQLKRYSEYPTRKGTKPTLIYLTPDGTEPVKYTLGSLPEDEVVCLSYCNHIIDWVDDCIKEVARIPQIRETLHQYQMTVKKLTGLLSPEVEKILNDDEELKGSIIKHLQCEFWKKIKEQLADQNPEFQLYESGMEHTEISDEKLKDSIPHPSLGLTFSIPNSLTSDKEHEVAFRVQYESPRREGEYFHFNYGFVFCKRGTLQRDKFEKDETDIEQYKIKDWPKGKGDDGWISWKYFRYKPESFITESKETLIRRLTSEINSLLHTIS